MTYVHRIALELQLGRPLGDGMNSLHKCDNPPCVNPKHLFLGDNSINQLDRVSKGRHHNARKTHCKHGHELTDGNTYTSMQKSGRPRRLCKICRDRIEAARPKGRRWAK